MNLRILSIRGKIEEEKERLNFLKEHGEGEEYVTPKRTPQGRGGYTEMPTIPDIDAGDTAGGYGETGFDMETDVIGSEASTYDDDDEDHTESETKDEEEDKDSDEEDESFFSDRNRWRRGGIPDPDADEW